MFRPALLLVICAVITHSHAGKEKPATCTPEYEALKPISTMCLYHDDPRVLETGVSDEEKQEILDVHNNFRASVNPSGANLFKLVWDDKVAAVAQKLSQQCKMFHDKNRRVASYPGVHIGQNCGAGMKNWTGCIGAWHNEFRNYEYGVGSTNGKSVGHYTQVVNARAIRIGCGYSRCSNFKNAKYYVCNYAVGQLGPKKPYALGEQCSACPDNCENGLCNCGGLLCLNGGKLDINACTCTCPKSGEWGGKDCSEAIELPCEDTLNNCEKKATKSNCAKKGFNRKCCASCAKFE